MKVKFVQGISVIYLALVWAKLIELKFNLHHRGKEKRTNMKESIIFSLLCFFLEIAYRFSIHTSKISKHSHPRTPVHTRLESFKCIQCTPAV